MCAAVNPRRTERGMGGMEGWGVGLVRSGMRAAGPRPGSVRAVTGISEEQQMAFLACPAQRSSPSPSSGRQGRGLLLPEVFF